ncbi:nucleotidyl transferase AbiEii/AbiGii toxin family protein [Hydrogenobaculum sp.]
MKVIIKRLSDKPLIFKGGSALMFFYGLDRFSEDLDFDASYSVNTESLEKILRFLGNVTVKKDTDTTKRFMINLDNETNLKIEISLRGYEPIAETIKITNNLMVYNIDDIAIQKLEAFNNRIVARDLYDIGFILERYGTILLSKTKLIFLKTFSSKEAIYELIPRYYNAFESDEYLLDSDLLKSVERIMKFYESAMT